MARKWQKMAVSRRRQITAAKPDTCYDSDECSTTSVAEKGHFVVYTMEGKRFMVPLAYLGSRIFEELFNMSKEEFGLPGDGPITLPCDAVLLEYVMSLLRRRLSKEMELALLSSILIPRSHACSLPPAGFNNQVDVCSF
ncbi:auxin-responsive protein SAUR68-like [Typha angustifolia]|uniref:auxin-responsive protein SAUR68-like n=1 Tax=Typha angustifolia TaxID=59011 RepID=UPI003C2C146F